MAECGMSAGKARGKDPHSMGYEIWTRACERELEEGVQRDPAEHGAEHQPSHRGLASQKQVSHNRKCYESEHNGAAQTRYVARRFL
jgi:hypothetical protein